MPFDEILGQEEVIGQFRRSLAQNRLAHAYILQGPPGVGKRQAALGVAQALNCSAGTPDPCGQCNNCRRIAGKKFPDVVELEPEGSSIKISQIRGLQREMGFRPLEGRAKVYIIADAHKMTDEAANSFLRILEEPPSYVYYFLLAPQEAALLSTIRSRCQILTFAPLSHRVMVERLCGEMGLDPQEARLIAALSAGSWARAQELAVSGCREFQSRVTAAVDALCNGDRVFRWQWAGELEGDDRDHWLEQLLLWYRDLLVYKETGSVELLLNQGQETCLARQGEKYRREELVIALQAIMETIRRLGTNVNEKLALEVLVGRLEPAGERR